MTGSRGRALGPRGAWREPEDPLWPLYACLAACDSNACCDPPMHVTRPKNPLEMRDETEPMGPEERLSTAQKLEGLGVLESGGDLMSVLAGRFVPRDEFYRVWCFCRWEWW